ncbi:MAG: sugar phosphate isomerase/epimerase [Fimbriimonadaceae bacterium]|jgi:sugar phosphate isomerase/epimerase|nr:sugar phosphate isomerase/epimerase [Fimbriimonadaceae bacterium]
MKIAFNSANLVGRANGYQFSLSRWMDFHHMTVEKTDEAEWDAICQEIASNGYTAVEIWAAHLDPSTVDLKSAQRRLRIMHDHGISAIGYAGSVSRENAELLCTFGISTASAGFGQDRLEEIHSLCEEFDLYQNYENHPEKTVEEILARIDGGSERIGVAIDSGWCGTQNMNAPDAISQLGDLVRHVHVKDVLAPGAHETCILGDGIVDLEGMITILKQRGYSGWYSWEDEPENRNPFDSARQNRLWLESQVSST